MVPPADVTALLAAWSRGNRGALDRLLPVVYAELRRIAARQLRSERAGHLSPWFDAEAAAMREEVLKVLPLSTP